MDSSLLELLQEITLYDLILTISLIILFIGIIISQKNKISKHLNKWRKTKNEDEDFHKLVYDLRDTVGQFQKNRENDREVSRRIRTEIYEVINKQSESIDTLIAFMKEEQKRKAKTKRAEIKASIERLWWECHPTKTCTETQFEVLKDLIEEYEEYGGENSFIHTNVEPEMYEWEKIKNI